MSSGIPVWKAIALAFDLGDGVAKAKVIKGITLGASGFGPVVERQLLIVGFVGPW